MAESEVLKLLGYWPSVYAIRVRMVLEHKGLSYEYFEEEDLYSAKSELLLKYNPIHKKVPVLIHGDRGICESLLILEYIDENWSATGPSVLPADPYERAMARFWAQFIDDKFLPACVGILKAPTEEGKAQNLAQTLANLEQLEGTFKKCSGGKGKGKGFFHGDAIGLVDVTLGSQLTWVKTVEKMSGAKLLDETKVPLLTEWARRFLAVDGMVQHLPSVERIEEFVGVLKQTRWKVASSPSQTLALAITDPMEQTLADDITARVSPPSSPPLAKKPKVSSPSDTEPEPPNENETKSDLDPAAVPSAAPSEHPPRYKRRKVAIFLGYCGHGYQGMQKNPGAKTIEGDLEEALYLAGGVPEADRGAPRRYEWARAARTDKGVSAAAQVVSGRFYVDPPGFVDRLNDKLADQIHIYGYKRVTNAFNAKKFCDRRRYIYLLPVFALDPSAHPDREAVMASIGSGNELAKCVECSERGRKVPGLMGHDAVKSNGDAALVKCEGSGSDLNSVSSGSTHEVVKQDDGENLEPVNGDMLMAEVEAETNTEKVEGVATVTTDKRQFCYGDAEKQRFNKILKYYEGTHNFHNFTTRTKAEDPSARRFIISFNANSVVSLDGIDFVKCEVVGQSFMLHQIRKMVGLAVAIMRNCVPESIMEVAFNKDVNINVPTAPEVGLFLDECLFSSYNKKWNSSHEEISMKDYEKEVEEFKMKFIYSHIAMMEHKEGAVALWLHSLNRRNYPDFNFMEKKGQIVGKEETKEESLGNEEVKEKSLGEEEMKDAKLNEEEMKEKKLNEEEIKEEKMSEEEIKEIKEERLTEEEIKEEKLSEKEIKEEKLGEE